MGRRERQRMRKQREILHWAQKGHCAGCGRTMGWSGKGTPTQSDLYPTFDHFAPKSWGGRRIVANGLLKHQLCNNLRADRRPTGCDLVWHDHVLTRLRSLDAVCRWGAAVATAWPGELLPQPTPTPP